MNPAHQPDPIVVRGGSARREPSMLTLLWRAMVGPLRRHSDVLLVASLTIMFLAVVWIAGYFLLGADLHG